MAKISTKQTEVARKSRQVPTTRKSKVRKDDGNNQFWSDYNSLPGKIADLKESYELIQSPTDYQLIEDLYYEASDIFEVAGDMKALSDRTAKSRARKSKVQKKAPWSEGVEWDNPNLMFSVNGNGLYSDDDLYGAVDSMVRGNKEGLMAHIKDEFPEYFDRWDDLDDWLRETTIERIINEIYREVGYGMFSMDQAFEDNYDEFGTTFYGNYFEDDEYDASASKKARKSRAKKSIHGIKSIKNDPKAKALVAKIKKDFRQAQAVRKSKKARKSKVRKERSTEPMFYFNGHNYNDVALANYLDGLNIEDEVMNMLTDSYGSIEIAGYTFSAGKILHDADPILFNQVVADEISNAYDEAMYDMENADDGDTIYIMYVGEAKVFNEVESVSAIRGSGDYYDASAKKSKTKKAEFDVKMASEDMEPKGDPVMEDHDIETELSDELPDIEDLIDQFRGNDETEDNEDITALGVEDAVEVNDDTAGEKGTNSPFPGKEMPTIE